MTILIIIAALIILLLLVALISKKGYTIQRDIIINRPQQEVFNYLKLLKNQDHYSKFTMMDPNMKKEFSGTDGTVGFVYGWEGNKKAGKGEQEIMKITEGERLDVEVRFIKPFEGIAQMPFTTTAISGNRTKVSWGMISAMKYPMNIMLLFIKIEEMLGKDLELSLSNLKTILER
jgi:hypothetical protein